MAAVRQGARAESGGMYDELENISGKTAGTIIKLMISFIQQAPALHALLSYIP